MIKKMRKIKDIQEAQLKLKAQYLAGLIDGEGTFCLRVTQKGPLRFTPLISLQMSDEATIAFAANAFGVSYDVSKKVKARKYHKTMYRLLVTTQFEIKQIAKALQPYSITKKRQTELILHYLDLESSTKEMQSKIDVFIDLAKANHRGPAKNYEALRRVLQKRL